MQENINEFKKQAANLAPILRGNLPGQPLFDYFRNRLPNDLPKEVYDKGLSCLGFARLILNELGGQEKAKIFWIERTIGENYGEADSKTSHAFVIPINARPSDLAYNNTLEYAFDSPLTVGDVTREGKDITSETLTTPWREL